MTKPKVDFSNKGYIALFQTKPDTLFQTKEYVKLHSKLQDLKDKAAIAKGNNAVEKHKKLSKELKELHIGNYCHVYYILIKFFAAL